MQRFNEQIGDNPRFQVSYLRCRSVLAHWQRNIEEEVSHLEGAASLAEKIGLPGEEWLIHAALGYGYETIGRETNAQLAHARTAKIITLLTSRISDVNLRSHFLTVSY